MQYPCVPTGPGFAAFWPSRKVNIAAMSSITGGMVIFVRTARIRACSALPLVSTSGPYLVSRPAR